MTRPVQRPPTTPMIGPPPSQRRTAFTARLPHQVDRDWQELITRSPPGGRFDPRSVAGLPPPAQRWLTHAIADGTRLRYCVELDQHGSIKLGSWRDFQACQVLAPFDGYIWAVTTRIFGLPIHGYDRLTHGTGDMHHRLLGRIPVVSSAGPDHTRSAAGRLAAEIIWVPAAALALHVRWTPIDDTHVAALIPHGAHTYPVTLTVAPTGALERLTVLRWTKLGKEPFRLHPFTAVFHDEATFDGYTVPAQTTAGYHYDPDHSPDTAFIAQTIDAATYH